MGVAGALGVPGVSIFGSMVGFSAIAREAGFDLPMSLATAFLVWGMPGQVAMASLHAAGSSAAAVFSAVALANMRMLMMTASGMEMLGLKRSGMPFWRKLLLAQMLAITSWVQLGMYEGRLAPPRLLRYFLGFGPMLYVVGMAGAVAGYLLSDWAGEGVLRAVLMLTPLYILLMVINARRPVNRVAGIAGGVVCPLLFPLIGEWSILVGGTAAGTAVAVAHRRLRGGRPA